MKHYIILVLSNIYSTIKLFIYSTFQIASLQGASIIHMLESTVGEEVLRNGLSKYLKAHKFGNAVTNDLWQAIQEAWDEYKKRKQSNKSKPVKKNGTKSSPDIFPISSDNVMDMDFTVKEMMDTWTLQTGYPIVTFTQQNDTNIYTIEQQRFLSAYKVRMFNLIKCKNLNFYFN